MPKLREIDQKPLEFMQAIKDFVDNPRGFFIMSGTNGNGKTFAARAIFEHFYHPHGDNQFWNQIDLKMKFQDVFAEYKSTSYLLDQVVKAPLLVLDDLGISKPTDTFADFLYAIADKRDHSKNTCGTIITTNLSANDFAITFGNAFLSRVASGIILRYDGPDRRRTKF